MFDSLIHCPFRWVLVGVSVTVWDVGCTVHVTTLATKTGFNLVVIVLVLEASDELVTQSFGGDHSVSLRKHARARAVQAGLQVVEQSTAQQHGQLLLSQRNVGRDTANLFGPIQQLLLHSFKVVHSAWQGSETRPIRR